mgnify:CR=1 FL=1
MNVSYGKSEDAWVGYRAYLDELIQKRKPRRVIEVGAGANPAFTIEYVKENNLEYTLLDISGEELKKAPDGYTKIEADICAENFQFESGYDLVFSRMLVEHVRSGSTFHRNIFGLLRSQGAAFHFFPTLYALPFVVNYLTPEWLSESLLTRLFPERHRGGKLGKFPAYYSWCRGPSRSQFRRFESLGYQVEDYRGFFGHNYYERLGPRSRAQQLCRSYLLKHPLPQLTAYAYVLLKKE